MAKWTQEMAIYGVIGAGTEEIANNIISERLLGLPLEAGVI